MLKAARNPVLDVGAAEGYLGRLGQLAAARALPGPFTDQGVFMAEQASVGE